MKITEEECKTISLKKFDFSCDDIDPRIPKPLPQSLNHFILICGKAGTGKTSIVLNLIAKRHKIYNKRFDKIYLFSPSMATMEDSSVFDTLPDDQKFTELDYDDLQGVLDEIEDSGEKVLFIMDDVVNDMRKDAHLERLMARILMNRRHLCGSGGSLSVWATTQVYNKIPPPVRKNASQLILFNTKNKRELDCLFDEVACNLTKKEWIQLTNYVFKNKHDFMYIDTNEEANLMYHKKFNKLKVETENDYIAEVEEGKKHGK
jgi:Cdc6-like AAA superfamily ATPase|tara:strand:- start:1123 stop:1905 length:783 start_codon:yes stop_codon:yes gene_type:complete